MAPAHSAETVLCSSLLLDVAPWAELPSKTLLLLASLVPGLELLASESKNPQLIQAISLVPASRLWSKHLAAALVTPSLVGRLKDLMLQLPFLLKVHQKTLRRKMWLQTLAAALVAL